MIHAVRFAGFAAGMSFAAAVYGFGAALEGYLQSQYPVALLGADGFPHAQAFNLIAFVVPGILAGVAMLALRHRLPGDAGWLPRIGAQLALLSALGFAAMGLLPLDPRDLEGGISRLHGTAWMLWCLAFVVGAALLWFGLRRKHEWSWFARISLAAAAGVPLAAFVLGEAMPAGIAQRIAFGLWFLWLILAGRTSPVAVRDAGGRRDRTP
ncbi:MAG TPA: DUF998 domain-containing protein [Pseudoxanthomonas sp.]